MIKKIQIHPNLLPSTTDLYIGRGLLESDLLRNVCQVIKGKVVILADAAISDSIGLVLQANLNAELLTIPGGEGSKSQETLDTIIDTLFTMGCGRDSVLIALGGGAITDLAGFIASIYLRGIPLIFIPTTLLAMVDAAIGGKNAINTMFGKNLIGTIYHSKAIFVDLRILDHLPQREKWNGLAEILKIGLVFDPLIWDLAIKDLQIDELISKAINGKIAIIQEDPTEMGLRRILNFGHTIGHGLEKISTFQMPHGIAVAIGCLAEAHLSMSLGYLEPNAFAQLQIPYAQFPLHLPKGYSRENLFAAMKRDKKNARGQLRIVLIDQIGHALPFDGAYCRPVTENELNPTLHWMETRYG